MDKKKLSAKEIFRTIVFQYHLDQTIPLELLAEIVSTLYYPADPIGQAKAKYKKMLVLFMKEYNSQEKVMDEQQFCQFLQDLNKHSNEEYQKKLGERIFVRYSNKNENVIDEESFEKLAEAFQWTKQEGRQFFLSVADLKNQITLEKFLEYMNSLSIKK